MKFAFALITFCAFSLLATGLAKSDELSDLKAQVEKLMQKIEELEKKQKEQAEQVKKVPQIAGSVEKLEKAPKASEVVEKALGKGVKLGGHFKFFLADQSTGESNGVDQDNSLSAGVSDLWLYFRKSISDWMAIDIAPHIYAVASATPSLGGGITRSSTSSVQIDLDEAYLTIRTPQPYNLEFKAGAMYPMFSEEYATKTWWHEQYHGNQALVNLEAWRSTGLEVYRNFDFEDFSLPVYFYPWLNGEDTNNTWPSPTPYKYTDNNSYKNLLLHVAPNFFAYGARIKLLGSLGWGIWDTNGDNNSWQYALGFDVNYHEFNFSGEYLNRTRYDVPLLGAGLADGTNEGYYIRGKYTYSPKWAVLAKYSDVDLFVPGITQMLTDNYKTISLSLNYWIWEGVSDIIPQVEYVDAERSDGSQKLEYWRWTIGWRTTF
jgi:hypothetical protein